MDYHQDLKNLIDIVVQEGASDLHLSEGRRPTIRVYGSLVPLLKIPVLSKEAIDGLLSELINSENKKIFLEKKEMDFSYSNENIRFRGNAFFHQGVVSVALRLIPKKIKSLEELGLPPILEVFAKKEQGFFLVVGPVGHGKSTTLAAMVEIINSQMSKHILTIEDPVEYIFEQKKSIIDQREVKIDTQDFSTALKAMFREDIDVVMVGEMRSPETIATAVTAAETGHLVLSTLHTNNAAQTIDRIIDSFPAEQQNQIETQLSGSLLGIFSQRLVPRISGGMVPAYELLINNSAVSNLIRESRTHEINSVIETGSESGMIDLNRSLADLVRRGEITIEDAYANSPKSKMLEKMI